MRRATTRLQIPSAGIGTGKSRDNVSYSILEETGPAHDRSFVAGVFYQDRLLARDGPQQKEAQQNAACKVLNDEQLINNLFRRS